MDSRGVTFPGTVFGWRSQGSRSIYALRVPFISYGRNILSFLHTLPLPSIAFDTSVYRLITLWLTLHISLSYLIYGQPLTAASGLAWNVLAWSNISGAFTLRNSSVVEYNSALYYLRGHQLSFVIRWKPSSRATLHSCKTTLNLAIQDIIPQNESPTLHLSHYKF